ncbi:MAG: GDP-mannose 4,6-dehydratase [Candidatus Latescibacterota bacterium]|nr:GDP-mannose 4,6-dehydratase [Candidatus Latescibacterota bacterium]
MAGTIAVIGSNCFTGCHIVDALLARGETVVGISRSRQYNQLFLPYADRDLARFSFHQIDMVKDFDRLVRLLDECRAKTVIHVAALSEVGLSNERPVEYFETNTLAVVKLCHHLRTCGYLRHYIHISSAEILGSCEEPVREEALYNPSTPYAVSKAAADMFIDTLVQNFDFPATLIRSTNVYGRHQQLFKIIPRTAIYLKLGKRVELHGGGLSSKCFVHVRDVVDGLLAAFEQGKTGTFHFSVPSDITIAEIVRIVCEEMGQSFEDNTAVVGERLGQDARYVLDCTKARDQLGWEARVDFCAGVREVIDWVEANWDQVRREPLEYQHKV